MTKNKYFEKLASAAVFFSAHFLTIVFICFIVFLFYIAMLGIEITSAINHIPSMEDINKKIQSVSIQKDFIKKIDNFILFRQKRISGQAIEKNPFLPYQKEINNSSGDAPAVSPDASLPKVMP